MTDGSLSLIRCPALLVVGDTSPAVDAVVECNSRLNPTKTTLLKVGGGGLLLKTLRYKAVFNHCELSPQMADCGGLPQVVQVGALS